MLMHELASLDDHPLPEGFPSPFDLEPHPLAKAAARDLQQRLKSISNSEHDFFTANGGKMVGVLVVQRPVQMPDTTVVAGNKSAAKQLAYLAAFSGMLAGYWVRDGFAPPVFDVKEREQILGDGETRLRIIKNEITKLLQAPDRKKLQQELAVLAAKRQKALLNASQHYAQKRQQRHRMRDDIRKGIPVTQSSGANAQVSSKMLLHQLALQSQQDKSEFKALRRGWGRRIADVQSALDDHDNAITAKKKARKILSRKLQKEFFSGYRLQSYADTGEGGSRCITEFFADALPPGGSGDCASIKLLNSCYEHKLKPVCMAEFWWGAPPPGGVRHHKHFYPACRGKCRPILPHMLSGLNVQSPRYEVMLEFPSTEPRILFEDEHIMVLSKPAGMLSVAGKTIADSVEHRLRCRYPSLVPAKVSRLLVHRLDQATSGLMVAAKNAVTHKALHQQFERRQVEKCYVAVVNGLVAKESGLIDLPLRVDLDDRPRQMVCHQHGKSARTHYRVSSKAGNQTRLQLFPITGRTHQLRVHLAHPHGLNAPIVGDELYGMAADRLRLHAERLSFQHPQTDKRMVFESPPPF